MVTKSPALLAAIKIAGNAVRLAEGLGISPAAVSQWKKVPALRVLQVEHVTGIPRWVLRPDIYPPPPNARLMMESAMGAQV